jgi:hypothetical protein
MLPTGFIGPIMTVLAGAAEDPTGLRGCTEEGRGGLPRRCPGQAAGGAQVAPREAAAFGSVIAAPAR